MCRGEFFRYECVVVFDVHRELMIPVVIYNLLLCCAIRRANVRGHQLREGPILFTSMRCGNS